MKRCYNEGKYDIHKEKMIFILGTQYAFQNSSIFAKDYILSWIDDISTMLSINWKHHLIMLEVKS